MSYDLTDTKSVRHYLEGFALDDCPWELLDETLNEIDLLRAMLRRFHNAQWTTGQGRPVTESSIDWTEREQEAWRVVLSHHHCTPTDAEAGVGYEVNLKTGRCTQCGERITNHAQNYDERTYENDRA